MHRKRQIPLGPGPPVDDYSDDDLDNFQDFDDESSDDELTIRRNIKPREEEQTIVTPPFLLQPKSDKPKKLNFTGHGAGCTRGAERVVKAPMQPPLWNPKTRSRPTAAPMVSNTECRFSKNQKQDISDGVFESDLSARDMLQDSTEVPTGSYEEDRRWLKRLEDLWSKKSNKDIRSVTEMLEQIFVTVANPYVTALYLIEGVSDYKQGKSHTLSMMVAREFEKWTKQNAVEFKHCLSKDIKIAAFKVALQGQMTPMDALSRAFELNHEGNEYFLRLIQPLIEKKRYKEAGQCISRLGLHEHYSIKDVCFPLLLQDKINLVENYVSQRRKQQEELLQLMDWLVDDETDTDDVIRLYSHVPNIRKEKLDHKPLHKLAVRLMKLYQVPDEMCPNIATKRSLKGVRYLLYKRYLEETLTPDQFEELMQSAVGDSVTLREQLVDGIIDYLDIEEAVRWALFYQVDIDRLPQQVKWAIFEDKVHEKEGFKPIRAMSSLEEESDTENNDDEANNIYYRSYNLAPESIHFVDTPAGFTDFINDVTTTSHPVGLDCEWRPSFGQTTTTRLSLMQVATEKNVYILDVLALMDILKEDDWKRLVCEFLCRKDILKLGYGIHGDLTMLARALPYLDKDMQRTKSILDLQIVHDNFKKSHPEIFLRNDVTQNQPLSHLSETQASNLPSNQSSSQSSSHSGSQPNNESTSQSSRPGNESSQSNSQSSQSPYKTKQTGANSKVVKHEERGLSELVRLCFGKPLSKKEQISDWERRPLRAPQLQYAALDARCLCEIFAFIESRIKALCLDIDLRDVTIRRHTRPKTTKAERRQKRVADRKEQKQILSGLKNPDPVTGEAVPVQDFRVVVDNMLQGLGRQLRSCGADVKVLAARDHHNMCARIANAEQRVILTSGMPFATLRSAVPLGMCYSVSSSTAKQQVGEVLQQFNVQVTQKDIFTRCQVCNGNEYLFVSPSHMKEVWHRKQEMMTSSATSQKSVASTTKNEDPEVTSSTMAKTASNTKLKECDNNQSSVHNTYECDVKVKPTSSCDTKTAQSQGGIGHGKSKGTKSDDAPMVEWKPLGRGAAWQGPSNASSLKPRARGRGVLSMPNFSKMIGIPRPSAQGTNTKIQRNIENEVSIDDSDNTNIALSSSKTTRESSVDPEPNLSSSDPTETQKQPKRKYKVELETNIDNEPQTTTEMTLDDFMAQGSSDSEDCDPAGSTDSLDQISLDTLTVGNGIQVKVETIPEPMLDTVELFYVCRTCGKVFWEGSHFVKVKDQFSHVLSDDKGDKDNGAGVSPGDKREDVSEGTTGRFQRDKSSLTMKAISQGLLQPR